MRSDDLSETPPAAAGEGQEDVSFEIAAAATVPPEPARLDPNRATAEPEPPPAGRRRGLAWGVVGSRAVHLSPLLLLLSWTGTPTEIAEPIPVQLVIEQPPPPPPPAPKPEEFKRPPPGRLASEDMGEKASPPPEAAAAPPAPEPAPTQVAAAVPPPPPSPPPSQPAPTEVAAAIPPPKPIRPPKPVARAFEWHRLDTVPQAAPRETGVAGVPATRDEYLAYCMSLVRRHLAALSPGFLAGRRGVTLFRLVVLDDGTIARITLAHPSPYPEIDARIEEAVNAVHRFPPLPQWLQRPAVDLILQVIYPDGL
jgi:periplasmic protein TonB